VHALGVFDNLSLLKIWCEVTPRTIFPHRKIGRLQEGYEASFLVLDGNPLENFAHVQAIRRRFKQGFPLLHEGH
jgi:imidazolonepropionase-like amidohydrolase